MFKVGDKVVSIKSNKFYIVEKIRDGGALLKLKGLKILFNSSVFKLAKDDGVYAPSTGRKDDQGKVMIELIAPEYIFGTAAVLTHGASKYAPRNWESGIKYGRVFGAVMRHMWAWWRGERFDPDSGLHHLYHASCCIMFLVSYEEWGMSEWDDRGVQTSVKELPAGKYKAKIRSVSPTGQVEVDMLTAEKYEELPSIIRSPNKTEGDAQTEVEFDALLKGELANND